jgi:multiple sugar transport system permease protein
MLIRKIAISVLLLFSVFGGLGDAIGKERVVLRLWNIPARKNPNDPNWLIFKRFRDLHPEYDIKASAGITLIGQEATDTVLMSIAGGTAPDVLYVNFRKATSYISQNFLCPLDEYVEEWGEDLREKVHPTIWPIIKQKGYPDGKEHIYAIPYGSPLVTGLRYRKDLFKKAGLDPEKPPRNWDELYEYAKLLTKPEQRQYGWYTPPGMAGAYFFQNFIYQAGGDVVVQDKDGRWKAVYNSAAGVEALKFYQKLFRGRWNRNGKEYRGVTTTNIEMRDRAAMAFWILREDCFLEPDANPAIIGIAPVPVGPKGTPDAVFNQSMLGINASVKDKRVRDAAWDYIKFMASDEADRIVTKSYVDAGYGKLLNPKYLKKFGYDEILKDVPRGLVDVHEESMKYVRPEPYGKNCDMIYYELITPIDHVLLSDQVDYKAVLDKAVAHTNERLIGEVPADVMKKRRQVVGLFLAVLSGLLVMFFIRFVKIMADRLRQSVRTGGGREISPGVRRNIAWLFLLPALLTVLVWQYYPLLRGMAMAFQDYRIMGGSRFIGIDNFVTCGIPRFG